MNTDDVLDITSSSKYRLVNKSSEDRLNVTLIISNLNEEDDLGTYWCQGFLQDGTMLSMSNSFHLLRSSDYLDPCRNNLVIRSITSSCAWPSPVSTPTASVVSDNSSPMMTTDGLILTTYETETSIKEGQNTSTIPTGSSPGSNSVPILYIIIGIVGFLSIMCIVLGFIICFLWRRVTVKGDYLIKACYRKSNLPQQ